MRECGKAVQGYWRQDRDNPDQDKWSDLGTAFTCSVQIEDGQDAHEGDHAAREKPQTFAARERRLAKTAAKVKDIRHSQTGLGEFQGRPVTFAEGHAEQGSMLPHPSAPTGCPVVGCLERPMYKDMQFHIREHQNNFVNPAEVINIGIDPNRGNPYFAGSPRDMQVGPPAAWIKPTAPESPGWNIQVPKQTVEEKKEILNSVNLLPNLIDLPEPTRANREYDQQLPTKNEHKPVQDEVIDEIESRKAIGLERYGSLLQPENGRDALRDAFEEALDLTMYLKQWSIERDLMAEKFEIIVGLISTEIGDKLDEDVVEVLRSLHSWFNPGKF